MQNGGFTMDTRILAIDDDKDFLRFLKLGLKEYPYFQTTSDLKEAFVKVGEDSIDLALLDIDLGDENGLEVLKKLKEKCPALDVVMVSGRKDSKTIVQAIRNGAADYISKPFEIDEMIAIIEKRRPVRQMREKNSALMQESNKGKVQSPLIGDAESFKKLYEQALQVKGHGASILIEGESGTGKEVLARQIHKNEGDESRPFVAVNCAAIPENLLESELFGHEKGSFTGAHCRKVGKFELAADGDLFLDEISSLKWDMQAKILRALQEKEITRVGGNESISVDFRLIAASNETLDHLVEKKKFRRDLYHRLRVIPLKVPSLRQRREDIPFLAKAFLEKYNAKQSLSFTQEAISALCNYYWPGNIRELENLVQSLVILVPEKEITKKDLPAWVFKKAPSHKPTLGMKDFTVPVCISDLLPLKDYVRSAEQAYVEKTLELTEGDKSKAASLLNISRTRLYERLRVWELLEGK
jgi:two-component system, NtrC family, nitrogen regulation response regulator GlnG